MHGRDHVQNTFIALADLWDLSDAFTDCKNALKLAFCWSLFNLSEIFKTLLDHVS